MDARRKEKILDSCTSDGREKERERDFPLNWSAECNAITR